jgi:fatty acid-binding protein DegV
MAHSNAFCLVTDAASDLPDEVLNHPKLRILPVHVFSGGRKILDTRDINFTRNFYSNDLARPASIEAYSEPLSVNEMTGFLHSAAATQFDEILGVFVSASRSLIFARAKEAMRRARTESFAGRIQRGLKSAISADCVDSKALFAGFTAQVMDLLAYADRDNGIRAIIDRQAQIVNYTYSYLAPGDVDFILRRTAHKGEKSVSGLAAFAARRLSITPLLRGYLGETAAIGKRFGSANARQALFDLAEKLITQRDLLSPHVCLGYSGPTEELEAIPGFRALATLAKRAGVSLHVSHISVTSAVNIGPRSLALGVIARDHQL